MIKESLRLHPGVAAPLDRLVPASGLTIHNHDLPPGTIVGIHTWVVHHDPTIFPDTDSFKPDRWLTQSPTQPQGSSAEHLKAMERAFFTFGGGNRTCIGKNVSMLEMSKLVPQVLREFRVEWADDDARRGFRIETRFFAKQKGLLVRMVPRQRREKEV